MGYRSDVSVIIYGDTDKIMAFVANEKLAGRPKDCAFHPLDEPQTMYHERDVYAYGAGDESTMMEFNWYDVKWYDSFPEVVWWRNLASGFEEAYPTLNMEMAFVGEDIADNITEYFGENCEYHMNISRAIEKNLPMAGRCIKPDCECLDYCEAEDPYGKPQAKRSYDEN